MLLQSFDGIVRKKAGFYRAIIYIWFLCCHFIVIVTLANIQLSSTATKTPLVNSVGVFWHFIILFLIMNLSISLFAQNNNDGSDGAIPIVRWHQQQQRISERKEEDGIDTSSFHSLFATISPQYAYAKEHAIAVQHGEGPKIMVNNSNLKIETVFKGDLESPTSMAFLGPNDILVLEKNAGVVQRIVNGHMLPKPVLKVPIASKVERGMLGIAIARHSAANFTTNTSNAAAADLSFHSLQCRRRK